jgi:MFS transporter, ACS family, D-galactonate transporter
MSVTSSVGEKPSSKRWAPILILVLFATTINYLDRSIFGIARAAGMEKDLGLDPISIGYLGAAFSITYAFAQIPGGIFLDKFGVRVTYAISLITWSIFTGLQGLAHNFHTLFAYRLGLGLCETPCFPANSRILATWFPQSERARANSVYAVGQYAGTAFLSVPLVWITQQFGWHALFFIASVAGVLLGLYWYGKYREPHEYNGVSQSELDHIEAGGGLAVKSAKFSWAATAKILKRRQIVVAGIAQFCTNTVLVFFLLDFVNYLGKERDMVFLKAGIWGALPYMAAAVGVLCGGQLSDFLLRKTGSANIGRKAPIGMGMVMASCIALADFVPKGEANNNIVIAIMCVAFFGQGICNLGWTVISDVAPKPLIGASGGVFNLLTNLAGIVTPIAIGYIVQATGSYSYALYTIGLMPLIALLLYIFALGDIKRLEM